MSRKVKMACMQPSPRSIMFSHKGNARAITPESTKRVVMKGGDQAYARPGFFYGANDECKSIKCKEHPEIVDLFEPPQSHLRVFRFQVGEAGWYEYPYG